MANQRRMHKVAERIRSLVAMELQRVGDPRLSLVTITSVVVTNDLRQAKIYWMASELLGLPGEREQVQRRNTERVAAVQKAFTSATGLFRRAVAEDLGVKFAPELRFYHDDTVEARYTIEELFRKIKAESPVSETQTLETEHQDGVSEDLADQPESVPASETTVPTKEAS